MKSIRLISSILLLLIELSSPRLATASTLRINSDPHFSGTRCAVIGEVGAIEVHAASNIIFPLPERSAEIRVESWIDLGGCNHHEEVIRGIFPDEVHSSQPETGQRVIFIPGSLTALGYQEHHYGKSLWRIDNIGGEEMVWLIYRNEFLLSPDDIQSGEQGWISLSAAIRILRRLAQSEAGADDFFDPRQLLHEQLEKGRTRRARPECLAVVGRVNSVRRLSSPYVEEGDIPLSRAPGIGAIELIVDEWIGGEDCPRSRTKTTIVTAEEGSSPDLQESPQLLALLGPRSSSGYLTRFRGRSLWPVLKPPSGNEPVVRLKGRDGDLLEPNLLRHDERLLIELRTLRRWLAGGKLP